MNPEPALRILDGAQEEVDKQFRNPHMSPPEETCKEADRLGVLSMRVHRADGPGVRE